MSQSLGKCPKGLGLALATHLWKLSDPFFMIFLDLRLEVKVAVAWKQKVTLYNPNVYPHTKFGVPTSNNIGDILPTRFSRNEARGQGLDQ